MTDRRQIDKSILGIVAHDLRMPVTGARLALEILQHSGPLNRDQSHLLARAMKAIDHMEQMITNLDEYSTLEDGISLHSASLNLNVLILDAIDVIETLAAEQDIRINFEPSPVPPQVYGDARLLSQVIYNLLVNAIKYNRVQGEVQVSVMIEDNTVRVSVADNGHGLKPEDRDRVFDRFYRAPHHRKQKIHGTGLGLSICQQIVERHQGRIWIENTSNEGTTFSFSLPLHVRMNTYTSLQRRDGGFSLFHAHTPSESMDGVDDSQQESNEMPDAESKRDEV